MQSTPLFKGMEYSEDPAKLIEWFPIAMAGRDPKPACGGNKNGHWHRTSTLVRSPGVCFDYLKRQPGVKIF